MWLFDWLPSKNHSRSLHTELLVQVSFRQPAQYSGHDTNKPTTCHLLTPAAGRPIRFKAPLAQPPPLPLFLLHAFFIMWYSQCSTDLLQIHWQPGEFSIYLCIYLVDGGAVIYGPLVSGQRQTCWLLGYWETPPALISEEETDEEEDRRWERGKKKSVNERWRLRVMKEEAERQMDGSHISPLSLVCLQEKPHPVFPCSPPHGPVALFLSLSTKYRGLVQNRRLQPNGDKPQAQQTIT